MPSTMSNSSSETVKLSVDVSLDFRQALRAVSSTRSADMGQMLEDVLSNGEDADILIFANEVRETLKKVKDHRNPKKPKR